MGILYGDGNPLLDPPRA
jgi:hypothetical protein